MPWKFEPSQLITTRPSALICCITGVQLLHTPLNCYFLLYIWHEITQNRHIQWYPMILLVNHGLWNGQTLSWQQTNIYITVYWVNKAQPNLINNNFISMPYCVRWLYIRVRNFCLTHNWYLGVMSHKLLSRKVNLDKTQIHGDGNIITATLL